MLERNPDSRKGDNGKVLVIGGSERFYGAPILCALGAEAVGVDLIFPCLPAEHIEAAKQYSLNFILHAFKGRHLAPGDVKSILNLSKQADAVAIGPGLGTHPGTQEAVKQILKELVIPTVVDAGALIYTSALPKDCVLTPHRGEFQRLTGEEATPESVRKWSRALGAVILCKAPTDMIADGERIAMNETGTPLMTVGGTGDALAGLVAGLMARGLPPFEAATEGARLMGLAGEAVGIAHASLRAIDAVRQLPLLMRKQEK